MKRYAKWILVVVAAIAVLVVAAMAALPSLVDTPRVQALVATHASHALGRPVRFGSVSLSVFPLPAVDLRGLEVAEDPAFGTAPFLKLDTARLALRLRPLLAGRVEFGDLRLERPLLSLIQGVDGRWNVASLGAVSEPRAPRGAGRSTGAAGAGAVLGSRVKIAHGLVTYVARGVGAAARYRVEDVDLTLTPGGSLVLVEGSARVKPGDLALTVREGSLTLNVARSLLEAPVRARLSIDSKDVGDLVAVVAGPSPSLAGALKGTLAVAGTLGAPKASGDVELSGVKLTQTSPACPEPKRRTLTLPAIKVNAAWDDGRFAGRPLTTGLGHGTVTTNLTATLDRGLRVQLADLAIKTLPLEKVLVDFLCLGYAVSGPLDLTGALSLNPADLWHSLSGGGQLRIGPGKVVGPEALALLAGVVRVGGAISSLLSADLPAGLFASPLDFDSITGSYRITDGVVTTRDLLYTSRAMRVAVAGDYGLATGRMNLDLSVSHGRGEVRAKVTGTAASPSIRVAPPTILREVDPGKIERGLRDMLRRFRERGSN